MRRETQGLFSRWLFENGTAGAALEASAPRGTFVWDGGPEPVVCLVDGNGATPAICFARPVLEDGLPHRLVIDWSSRTDQDFPFFEDVKRAARSRANITLRRGVTTRDPRLAASDVAAWAQRFPSARFVVCGPDAYERAVTSWLTTAGVPTSQVLVERFVRAGGPLDGGSATDATGCGVDIAGRAAPLDQEPTRFLAAPLISLRRRAAGTAAEARKGDCTCRVEAAGDRGRS